MAFIFCFAENSLMGYSYRCTGGGGGRRGGWAIHTGAQGEAGGGLEKLPKIAKTALKILKDFFYFWPGKSWLKSAEKTLNGGSGRIEGSMESFRVKRIKIFCVSYCKNRIKCASCRDFRTRVEVRAPAGLYSAEAPAGLYSVEASADFEQELKEKNFILKKISFFHYTKSNFRSSRRIAEDQPPTGRNWCSPIHRAKQLGSHRTAGTERLSPHSGRRCEIRGNIRIEIRRRILRNLCRSFRTAARWCWRTDYQRSLFD